MIRFSVCYGGANSKLICAGTMKSSFLKDVGHFISYSFSRRSECKSNECRIRIREGRDTSPNRRKLSICWIRFSCSWLWPFYYGLKRRISYLLWLCSIPGPYISQAPSYQFGMKEISWERCLVRLLQLPHSRIWFNWRIRRLCLLYRNPVIVGFKACEIGFNKGGGAGTRMRPWAEGKSCSEAETT